MNKTSRAVYKIAYFILSKCSSLNIKNYLIYLKSYKNQIIYSIRAECKWVYNRHKNKINHGNNNTKREMG